MRKRAEERSIVPRKTKKRGRDRERLKKPGGVKFWERNPAFTSSFGELPGVADRQP